MMELECLFFAALSLARSLDLAWVAFSWRHKYNEFQPSAPPDISIDASTCCYGFKNLVSLLIEIPESISQRSCGLMLISAALIVGNCLLKHRDTKENYPLAIRSYADISGCQLPNLVCLLLKCQQDLSDAFMV